MLSDRMRYIVVSGHHDGEYLPERDLADTDRVTTIKHIQNGELLDVTAVIEINVAEGIVHDVTEDVLREAGKWRENQRPFTGQDLQDWLHDHERDRRKG